MGLGFILGLESDAGTEGGRREHGGQGKTRRGMTERNRRRGIDREEIEKERDCVCVCVSVCECVDV